MNSRRLLQQYSHTQRIIKDICIHQIDLPVLYHNWYARPRPGAQWQQPITHPSDRVVNSRRLLQQYSHSQRIIKDVCIHQIDLSLLYYSNKHDK
jgi:hypothetical protein